ncbi:MAG TPA: N,N-dimethylformamidase beta subunit family domain-containing protein, partial [Chloroflexota bacterium]|nr:N,N-dimethylformamidase beta subunit family domain-containing protein [Chloroflexota bacterium]
MPPPTSAHRHPTRRRGRRALRTLMLMLALSMLPPIPPLTAAPAPAQAATPCLAPANPVVAENCLPGNPASDWDLGSVDSTTIEGFATDISVDQGQTVRFKIKTAATAYRIDLYRVGYYGGLGARKVATVQPSAAPPQSQPPCLSDPATGLVDCGNWAVSASWTVPSNAASGVYLAKLVREDQNPVPAAGRDANHIPFVVRDDAGASALLFQTSDTTWQAYNRYGGNSLYANTAQDLPAGRAFKVSYNRPFDTRTGE